MIHFVKISRNDFIVNIIKVGLERNNNVCVLLLLEFVDSAADNLSLQ